MVLQRILLNFQGTYQIKLVQTVAKTRKRENTPNSLQFSSVAQSCPTLCDPRELQHARPPPPSPPPGVHSDSQSIESVMPSSHLILCRPLLLLPPIPPSIRVFSNESTLHMRWPKYWSFRFSILPSKEIPGLRK